MKFKCWYIFIFFLLLSIGIWNWVQPFFNPVNNDKPLQLTFSSWEGSPILWKEKLKNQVIDLLGLENDIPQAALLSSEKISEEDNYVLYKTQLLLFGEDRVNCYLSQPKKIENKQYPAVVFFSGHGEGIDDLIFKSGSYQQAAATYLAESNFVTLVCDNWGMWSSEFTPNQESVKLQEEFLKGDAILGLFVDQARAEVSWLANQDYVNKNKIGIAGVSLGGAISLYTCAMDDRINACYSSGYFTTFEKTYFNYVHSAEMIIPGLYSYADIPDIAGLIAPRNLYIYSGETDNSLALSGNEAREVFFEKLKPIFSAFNAEKQVSLEITNKGHILDKESVSKYFKEQFK